MEIEVSRRLGVRAGQIGMETLGAFRNGVKLLEGEANVGSLNVARTRIIGRVRL